MPNRTSYTPAGTEWMETGFGMSPAIRADDQVFLSGVTAARQDGEPFEAAIDRAFVTIGDILAEAGLSFDDVIDMTSFHVDLQAHKDAFLAVKQKYVTRKPYPAWTAIEVAGLWMPDLFVEIKITASADRL